MASPTFRNTSEWKAILDHLKLIFEKSTKFFGAAYACNITAFAVLSKGTAYISAHRMDELFRSCADDLYRYATYHDVDHRDGIFLIAQFVEAAYLTKWISTFHPIIINSIDGIDANNFLIEVRNQEVKSGIKSDKKDHSITDWFRKSNEVFNMIVASHTLCKTKKIDPTRIVLLPEFLTGGQDTKTTEDAETKDFLYTLRYRLKHQDIYRPIYRRIHEMPSPV